MNIVYPDNTLVNNQLLPLNTTQTQPEITIDPKLIDDKLYSIIMIDTDALINKTNKDASFLHWWVANINLRQNFSQVWFTYFPPTPPKNTGRHHYRFYLLRQSEPIIQPVGMDSVTSRAPFYFDYYVKALKMNIIDSKYFVLES